MSNLLSQNELARRLADANGLSYETAKKFIDLFFSIVKRELKRSETFYIANFGTFKRVWIEESEGINPATGDKITIPAHYRVKFSPSAMVALRINRPFAHLKAKRLPDSPAPVADTQEVDMEEESVPQEEPVTEEKRGLGKIILGILLGLLALILLLLLLIKGCSGKKEKSPEKTTPVYQEQEKLPEPEPIAEPEQAPAPEEPEPVIEPVPEPVPEPAVAPAPEKKPDTRYTVPAGSNYHTIAEQQYGVRHLWPCIYNANKEKMPHPDLVPEGAEIKLPHIDSVLADRELIQNAMLEAFNGYYRQIDTKADVSETAELRRLAAGVIASAEMLYPGFIDSNGQLPSEYTAYAKQIIQRYYPDYKTKEYIIKK